MTILLKHRTPRVLPIEPKYRNMCEQAAWRLRWKYNGYCLHPTGMSYSQRDWNQTLITKINQLSAQIQPHLQYHLQPNFHQSTLRGGANTIILPPDLLAIFEDLEYYKSEDKTLARPKAFFRYNVKVDYGIHPREILVYYDAPDHIRERNPDIDDNNRIYGVIRVDGLEGYVEPKWVKKKEMILLPKKYLLLTKHLVN
jgi:hypothetical protein